MSSTQEDASRGRASSPDLAYARGELDRDAYLAAKGVTHAPTRALGLAAEIEAARRELVNLRNRISALREERGRLRARLAVLEEDAVAALEELGLEAHERYEEKLALEDALKNIEAALRQSERARIKLETLVARLEAEQAAWRAAELEGGEL